MNKYVSRGLMTVLFTGGLMALGVGIAHADDTTSGENGTGSGTQAILDLGTPISISGNGISLFGDSSSTGSGGSASGSSGSGSGSGSSSSSSSSSGSSTNGSDSLLGGSQAGLGLDSPVEVSGNAISLLGNSSSAGSTAGNGVGGAAGDAAEGSAGTTDGTDSTAGGTQVAPAADLPITVEGNSISLLGDSAVGPLPGEATGGSGGTGGTGGGGADPGDLTTSALDAEALAQTGPADVLPGILAAILAIAGGVGIALLPEHKARRR